MQFRPAALALATAALTAVVLGGCGGGADPQQATLDQAVGATQQVQAFCTAVRGNIEAAKPIAALSAKGHAPHPADAVAAAVEPLRQSNRAMLAAAPEQIRPDAQVAFDLAELQLRIYQDHGGDPAAATSDPTYMSKVREGDAALKRLQGFYRTACGIG